MSNDLNKIILQAKLGDKKSFNILWGAYYFVMKDVVYSFKKVYKFLNDNEPEMFRMFYIFFWEAISTYSFSENTSFGLHLRKSIVNKTKKYIQKEYRLSDNQIVKNDTVYYFIRKGNEEGFKEKNIRYLNAVKILTRPQLLFFHRYFYYDRTGDETARVLNIKKKLLSKRAVASYRKIRNSYHGIRNKRRKDTIEEKAYFMYKTNYRENEQNVS